MHKLFAQKDLPKSESFDAIEGNGFSLLNEAEEVAKIINSTKFKRDMRVVELEKYHGVEIIGKFLIEGSIKKRDLPYLEELKKRVFELLVKYYGNQRAEALQKTIWQVRVHPFGIGEKFEPIELINYKGCTETLTSFEDEICLVEFWDSKVEISLKHGAYICKNAAQRFQEEGFSDKKIINYVGISNNQDYKKWVDILKMFKIHPDGQNMFQFNKASIQDEMSIEVLPYSLVLDRKGIIRYAGESNKLNLGFLSDLYKFGDSAVHKPRDFSPSDSGLSPSASEEFEEKVNDLELKKEESFSGTGLEGYYHKNERGDPNPEFSKLTTEDRIEFVRATNESFTLMELNCEIVAMRNVFYNVDDKHFYTKFFVSGSGNSEQCELMNVLIMDIKEQRGFKNIEVEITNTDSTTGNLLNALNTLNIINAMRSLDK